MSKSDLKNKMAINAKGTVSDLVDNFKRYLATKLVEADVYLIFGRY